MKRKKTVSISAPHKIMPMAMSIPSCAKPAEPLKSRARKPMPVAAQT
jgi:hypothetical protein